MDNRRLKMKVKNKLESAISWNPQFEELPEGWLNISVGEVVNRKTKHKNFIECLSMVQPKEFDITIDPVVRKHHAR
jgi:hypothetical protein